VKNLFNIAAKLIVAIIVLIVIYINVSLYYQPEVRTIDGSKINYDVLLQLRHLKKEVDAGGANEMQQIYPEGFVFLHSLYALAWCDLLDDIDQNSSLFKEGIIEIKRSTSSVNSEEGRSTFSEYQPLEYGAFYVGWSTYILGRKLNLSKQNPADVTDFKRGCERIADFIRTSETPYASSYQNMTWPADMMVCVAALSLHDRVFGPTYHQLIKTWLFKVKSRLDENGLIPHSVDSHSGKSIEKARGSSQSLILIFLNDIDQSFAKKQFELYDNLFVASRLGLPCIYEYPRGEWGVGDIDSGPVILGAGGAASIVGMRTLAAFSKDDRAIGIRNGIESFGLSYKNENGKSYLLGTLPIADAFITWANAGIKSKWQKSSYGIAFHFYSVLLLTVFLILVFKPWRRFAHREHK
jgi:hypothetical protein